MSDIDRYEKIGNFWSNRSVEGDTRNRRGWRGYCGSKRKEKKKDSGLISGYNTMQNFLMF